ncbi:MAG: ATP-binding cassette domain-containing protein [Acidimicrobiia bacterium]
MEPLVVLEAAGVSLGGQPVLRDIDLELAPGSVLGLVGPNGSGKTTLLRLLATLLEPDQGKATILGGRSGTEEVYRARPGIGLIGHTPSLIPELTLEENIEHMARLGGHQPLRGRQALSVVGLEEVMTRRADASSHGMLRRAEVALLLLRRCRLVLLDEATTGLDAEAAGLVGALVERTRESDGGVVMVSHDRSRLDGCDSILTLSEGTVEVSP